MEKTTIEYLKGYIIRYKNILLSLGAIILLIILNKLYNKYDDNRFNESLIKTNIILSEKHTPQEKITGIYNFFKKNNTYLINHKKIFVLQYTYCANMFVLKEIFKNDNHIIQLINEGQWIALEKIIKDNPKIDNKEKILLSLNMLEKIYQYTKKNNPYSSVLNGKYLNYSGEVLNTLIFYHMVHREKKEVSINFFHRNCLQLSLFNYFNKILYSIHLDNNNSSRLNISEDQDTKNLLKKFINW
jgi:hypothetical protein